MPAKSDMLYQLKYVNTRKDAFNNLKRILSENAHNIENSKLYNYIRYVASQTYDFSDDEYEEIARLALSNNVITDKQKMDIESWINNREGLITEREENESFVYYDRLDNTYQYDLDEGYYECN
jgi:hypothetical protein